MGLDGFQIALKKVAHGGEVNYGYDKSVPGDGRGYEDRAAVGAAL
jgi:hypothetical protein